MGAFTSYRASVTALKLIVLSSLTLKVWQFPEPLPESRTLSFSSLTLHGLLSFLSCSSFLSLSPSLYFDHPSLSLSPLLLNHFCPGHSLAFFSHLLPYYCCCCFYHLFVLAVQPILLIIKIKGGRKSHYREAFYDLVEK